MEHKIIVAGIGPGGKDYILPKSLRAIEEARFLAGGHRALRDYARKDQNTYPITGKLSELYSWIFSSLKKDDVTVMVSGDPGYYSLLPWLKKNFPQNPVEVIPGISSIQAAFSLLGLSWQDAEWLSFHGRVPDEKQLSYVKGRKIAFLTDRIHNPASIARILLDRGWPEDAKSSACENISYADQQIVRLSLKEMTDLPAFGESVLIVEG